MHSLGFGLPFKIAEHSLLRATPPMEMETDTRFTVDAAHCQRAEDELYAMLLRQDEAFAARWQAGAGSASNVVFKIARAAGILASLFGMVLTLGFLVMGSPEWAVRPDPWFLPVFGAGLVFFCWVPRIRPSLQASVGTWARRVSERSCRRRAQRFVRDARRLAPFEAHYDVKGSLLIYSREKDGRQIVWQRDLRKYRDRGLAIRGASVTAIFRRPGSFLPPMVILQDNSDWLTRVLQDASIASDPAA